MARRTYTITVILKAFFTDCRAQAKIFISEDIQTVLDLENKISRIFGIKDFHLLSNDNFLPSCEDIRLLDKGDIVSVLPNDSHTDLLLPKRFYSTIDEPIRCKKKKKQHLDDECPIKGKKSKKEKKETTLFDDEKFDDSTQCKANKKFEHFSNKKKKENKKCKDNAYINQISQPGQSLSSSAPHSIEQIKDSKLHVEKDKTFSLIDKKLQESVNVEEKMGGEHCIKVNSEKDNNINLLSDETSGAVSEITSIANNHRLHNSPTKFKKTTNKQLISSSNNSFSKMILDSSSSSSDSEIEKTISTTKQSISNTKQSKFLGQSINKTETNKNVIEESSETYGFDKVPQKGCSFYQLPTKKGNLWSTSPLQKTTNHVKIEKVPLTVTDTDLSNFIFNPCNMGVIPVPNHETTSKHIMNDFPTSDSNMVNLSQHNSITLLSTQNASMEEISASACDELNTKFSPYSNNITDKEIVKENHLSSNDSLKFIPSILNLKNILKSEEVVPIVSNKVCVDNNDSQNFGRKITKKRFIMNKWKKKCFNNLDDATQNSLQNLDETSSIVNKVLEANVNEQIRNMTNQPLQISPKVVKLNSYKIRKNTTNKLGMNHYMKLLNKIDWDLSKSISNVNPNEIQSPPENTKLDEQVQSPLCVENKMNSLESIDLSRPISNLNIDEIQSQYGNEKLVGQVESPLYVQNKMNYLENIDVSKYISNSDEVQSQSGNEKLVWQVESPLYVQNKMKCLENIDVSKYISNPDEDQSKSGNEELVRQEKAPLYVENKMNYLENIDMSSVSSTVIDLATKRKRKRKHKKKIRADTPATVKSCNFLPFKQHTLVKGTPKLHIRFESDEKDYLHEDEDEISANFENSSKNVKVLQDICLDLSRNEGNICHVGSISTERDIEGNNPNACILSVDIMDASKPAEKEVFQDVCLDLSKDEGNICHVESISTERDIERNNPNACILSIDIMDSTKPTEKEFEIVSVLNHGISTKSIGVSSKNLVELHEKNENIVSSEGFESISKDCKGNEKNLESGFQKSALDYTNENLTSYENTYIAKSSSNSPKLGIISPEEALAQAKVALLKAVGFLSTDQPSTTRIYQYINADIQNTDISVDGAINLSGSGVINTQKTETFL